MKSRALRSSPQALWLWNPSSAIKRQFHSPTVNICDRHMQLSLTSYGKNCQSLLYLQLFSQLLRVVRVLLGNSFEPLYSCAANFPGTLKSFGTCRCHPILISSGHCNSNITPHSPLWGNENVPFRVVEVWAFYATAHPGLVWCCQPTAGAPPPSASPRTQLNSTSQLQFQIILGQDVLWEVLPAMERLWEQHQCGIQRTERGQRLFWCDSCLWWRTDRSSQSDPLCLLNLLQESVKEEPSCAPTLVPEGR